MVGGLSREARAAEGYATLIGLPLTAHQRDLLAPLVERDGIGYTHPSVLILAPRQVAKTTSMLLLMLARMTTRRGYAAAYTAQTGIVVTHVFTNPGNGWMTITDQHLSDVFRTLRSQGREAIAARRNPGAYLKAFPPAPGRLRSNSLDAVMLDECQEHDAAVGDALLGDTGPTFTTRPRRQLVLIGTAGTADSWWRTQYDRARAGDYRLIELGTWPAEADIDDPAVWRAHHPGLLAGMTDTGHLAAQARLLGPDRFAREYGNRWAAAGGARDNPITDELWRAAALPAPTRAPPVPTAIAFDADTDTAAATIVAAGTDGGRIVAGIAESAPGADWLPARVAALHRAHPRAVIACDPAGPAAAAVAALQRAGVPLALFTGNHRPAGCAGLLTACQAGRLGVLPHPMLDGARAAAARRPTEGGGWIWSRRRSEGGIAPLTALTMAVWAAERPAAPRPRAVAAPPR